jgi:hypothetical protein
MGFHHLRRSFAKIGARLRISSATGLEPGRIRLNVLTDDEGEFFDLGVSPESPPEVTVINIEPKDQHLLLLARDAQGRKSKYLLGEDERHLFVAGLPRLAPAGTVRQAKQALRPPEVQARQVGLSEKVRNRRKNSAFLRQGEWFFIPAPDLTPDPLRILHDEPISRGNGSKPHILEFCYREGGETVYVSSQYPNGVDGIEFARLQKFDRQKTASERIWDWRQMKREAVVYGKGKCSHPDHRTIVLHEWCRVLLNEERHSTAMGKVVFLD